MRLTILIVAGELEALLGLAQAMLKFGYQIATARPDADELDRGAQMQPGLVLLRPPPGADLRATCLGLVKDRFARGGVPILACVSDAAEESEVHKHLPGTPTLVGMPMKLNDLYRKMQDMFDLARRGHLRITTEQVVAHREPGLYQKDFYYYDTMRSLSLEGCFIETEDPYPVGTPIEMVFCVGSASRSLRITGSVTRVGETGQGVKWPGMGIRFENLSEAHRSTLESYLMTHLGTLDLPATI